MTAIESETEQLEDCHQQASITLNPSAVFQLLLLGLKDGVRDAAAHALAPFIAVDPQRIVCLDADFRSLARWEQTTALLVATMIAKFPDCTASWTVGPESQPRRCRLFQYLTDPELRRPPGLSGVEEIVSRRVTYAVETSLADNLQQHARRAWLDITSTVSRGADPWSVDDGRFGISFAIPYRVLRARSGWQGLRLLSPEGTLVARSIGGSDLGSRGPLRGWGLDSGLLLRLESGALQGHVLERWYQAARPRWDRHSRCVVTAEIGASIEDPPIVMMAYGEVANHIAIDRLAGRQRIAIPLLGGATIESLDAIARKIGVWHGESLRGSFTHHPLRERHLAEVA